MTSPEISESMIKTNLFEQTQSRKIIAQKKGFSVLEYEKDLSVTPQMAQESYFESLMNVRKRQLIIELKDDAGAIVQASEMQMIVGDIDAQTGIKGAGDFLKKIVDSAVTKETVVKPYYRGDGLLVLEPTYRYIDLIDLCDWEDGIVIEDGMFLACEDTVEMETISRKTISSAVFGKEGLFNSVLYGEGILALESPVPGDELVEIDLDDDMIKIDGNMAIAWSPGLRLTVQKSFNTLVGSLVSGEGLVNVYEGTGKVIMAPVRSDKGMSASGE